MNKKAFTIVELVVVLTILAILGTIGFLSFQGYNNSSRDSVRLTALSDMQKILELSMVQDGYYPEPTGATEITYTGGQVWLQGEFGDEISINVDGLTANSFIDPLTKINYTYSRLNTRNEYQLAGILEGSELSYNNSFKTYAGENIAVTKIVGNYNGQVASVKKGTKTFILAVPTIISGDINLTRIEDLVFQNKLIYNGFKNLPSNYKDSLDFNPTGETNLNLVNESNIVVFSGSTDDLNDENKQIELIKNLQLAYDSTNIQNNEAISKIFEYNTVSNPEGTKYIAQTIINKNINKKIEITAENTPNPVYLANTCLEMNSQQVGALNTFFNGSGYNGDVNYWCGLISINAGSKGLTGSIPHEIGNLTNLSQLYLNSNSLTGNIPAEIGNLTNLTQLILYVNQLSGPVPSEIGNLTNLQKLYLNNNSGLNGNIPVEISNLSNLRELIIQNNGFSGDIPSGIWNLTNLRQLSIADLTNINPWTIPSQIGNLTNIQYLNFQNSHVTGEMPTEIGTLTNLISLSVGWGDISKLPDSLTNLNNLGFLTLYGNTQLGQLATGFNKYSDNTKSQSNVTINGNSMTITTTSTPGSITITTY